MALTQITTDGIKDGTITGTDLATNIDLVDNQKLRLGTGSDLEVFHNGSQSYLNSTNGSIELRHTVGGASEALAKFIPNGSVELYHDNDKVLNTISNGIQIDDNTTIFENSTHNTAIIQHADIHHAIILRGITNASGSTITNNNTTTFREYGDFVFRTGPINAHERFIILQNGTCKFVNNIEGSTDENMAVFNPNGAVELYYDNSLKLSTGNNGINVSGSISLTDVSRLYLGSSNDFELYHDGSNSHIKNATGNLTVRTAVFDVLNADGSERMMRATANAGCELFFNGNAKVQTRTGDTLFLDDIRIQDNNKINIGTGDDLQIYHDGSNSYIDDTGTGDTYIRGDNTLFIRGASNEDKAKFTTGGSVELYCNDSKKFETTSSGVTVTGNVNSTNLTNSQVIGYSPNYPAESADAIKSAVSGTPDNAWYWIKQFGNVARLHYCVFKDQNGSDIAGGPWTMNWIAGVNPNQFSSTGSTSITRYLNLCKGIGIDKPGRGMESSRTTSQVYGAWLAVKRALWDLDPGFFQDAGTGSGGVLTMPIMNINGEGGSSDHRVIYSSGTGTHIPPNQDGDHCNQNQLFCGWWGGNDFSSWATNNNTVPSPEDWGPGDPAHSGSIGEFSNSTAEKPSWRFKMLVTCIYK